MITYGLSAGAKYNYYSEYSNKDLDLAANSDIDMSEARCSPNTRAKLQIKKLLKYRLEQDKI